MDENKVLFSSEYDDKGMKDGVESTLVQLEKLQKNVNDARENTKNYNKELKNNQTEVDNVHKKLVLLNNVHGKNKDAIVAAGKELEGLAQKNAALTTRLADANLILTRNTRDLRNYQKELNATNREHQLLHRATEKFTNINHLAAEGINHMRRQVVDFGLGLASGFAGVIIGAAIPSVDKLIEKIFEFIKSENEAKKQQEKITEEISAQAIKGYSAEVTRLGLIKEKLDDLSIPQAKRIALAKDYNKTAEEGNKIDLKQINNIDLLNAAIDRQIAKIKERAFAKAAENIVAEKAEKVFLAQMELEVKFPNFNVDKINSIVQPVEAAIDDARKRLGVKGRATGKELIAVIDLPESDLKKIIDKNERFRVLLDDKTRAIVDGAAKNIKVLRNSIKQAGTGVDNAIVNELQKNIDKANEDLNNTLKAASPFITVEGLFTDTKTDKEKKALEDDFEKRRAELKEQIAKLAEGQFQDEIIIRKEYQTKLDKALLDIRKDKSLKANEREILNDLARELNTGELNKALEEFHKKVREATEKIQDDLKSLELQGATERIANLRDQFEREKLAIEQGYNITLSTIDKKQRETFTKIDEDVKKGLISDEDGVVSKLIFMKLFGDLKANAGEEKVNKQLELSMKVFQNTIKEVQATLNNDILNLSEETTQKIDLLTTKYLSGQISYEKYQKGLTKIVNRESDIRREKQLKELDLELKLINAKLVATQDPEQNKTLIDQQQKVRNQILALQRESAGAQATETKKKKDEQISSLLSYVNAIGDLTNSIIGFWQKVNEVEQRQIEHSIALQEKRVTAAQRIADRGNAEYLRQEEDRLTQLQIKQENAAKKQLAINAVLTASQALVAFISAIAQGAKLGGALGAIVDAAAIIGLLGTGYSIVKSLQANSPKLFRGTKSAERMPGEKAGQDTLLRWINEKEAVIPADTNQQYKPAVEAIYDKAIPADVLNKFVMSYPRVKAPQLNYNMIGESAEMKINSDGRLVGLLSIQNQHSRETIEVMRSVDKRLKDFGVDVNMDSHGFALSILRSADKMRKSSKA